MKELFRNTVYGVLAAGINASAVSAQLVAGHGARFGTIGADEFIRGNIITSGGDKEAVIITARSTDTLTIARAQDGSTGLSFLAGDRIECRIGKSTMERMLQAPGNTLSRAVGCVIDVLADGAHIAWDASMSNVNEVTLAGNHILDNPTGAQDGNYLLHVFQDATGGRTLSYGTNFKWIGGVAPVLSTAAGAHDILSFTVRSGIFYGVLMPAFA